jgi:hypothetical protein
MLRIRALLILCERFPVLGGGPALHRSGLLALASGDEALAVRLFACAVERYRREVNVLALARLRAHEAIARARRHGDRVSALEAEQRLCRLERIESLEPPFELTPAHRLLGSWSAEEPEPALPRAA